MKPLFKKITDGFGYSFSFVQESPPLFDTPWHFHPEYELIFIKNSTGKRYMGDHIADFDRHELVLVGPNVPHFWQNDADVDLNNSLAYVVHFRNDFLGETFFNIPEAINIKRLLERAQTSLRITGRTNLEICDLMEQLPVTASFNRLLLLQKILYRIAESGDLEPLASPSFMDSFNTNQEDRINKVYEYVMYNFREKITLSGISRVAYMSEEAFCRYFKMRTGKTFFVFLNDIRIGYACRLLLESNMNITEIAYESGFNNLSHFNRQFKEHTAQTPQKYRELFRK